MQQQSKIARRENALQPQETPSCGCFPDGVMEIILIQLPVKSLIRFKAVCKSWRNFLSSPYFVQMQVDHAKASQKLLCYSMNTQTYIPEIAYVGKTNDFSGNNRVFTPFQFKEFDGGVIEDSCNGLLSFRLKSSSNSIYLWNPATRESKWIELPYLDISPCVGIAFLDKINEYKMVRIPNVSEDSHRGDNSGSRGKSMSVWVYSLNLGSWKELKVAFNHGPLSSGQAVLVQGCMHWTTEDGGGHIAAFDVENEVLRDIPLPNTEGLLGFCKSQLGIIRGCVSFVLAFRSREHDLAYEIWRMNEYGVASSWTKLVFIPHFREIAFPIGYYDDGKFLFKFFRNNDEDVFSYDPFAGVKKYFRLSKCYCPQIVTYTETLVSLGPERSRSHQERPLVNRVGELSLAGCGSHGNHSGNLSLCSRVSAGEGKHEESDPKGKRAANLV